MSINLPAKIVWRRRFNIFFMLLAFFTATSLVPLMQNSPSAVAIQGGESAKGTSFVVAIVVRLSDSKAELCSGGVVTSQIIATAAHCVVQNGIKSPLNAILIFPPGQEISIPLKTTVKAILIPEGYQNNSPTAEPDDIAFLVLETPVNTATLDSIADAATVTRIVESKVAIRLYGYGITGRNESAPNFPKVLTLKPIEKVLLQGFSGKENTYISYAQENSGAACNGDSGGPAVAQVDGKLVLVSVHSASAGICSEASTFDSNWGTIPGEYRTLFDQAISIATASPSIPTQSPSPLPSNSPTPSPTPTPSVVSPSTSPSVLPSAIPVKKKITITCVKGKLLKKVTAIKPKCPKGYVRKK